MESKTSPLLEESRTDKPANKSYLVIYIVISSAILFFGFLADYVLFTPRKYNGFFLYDPNLSHPIADPESVPSKWLDVNGVIVLFIVAIIQFVCRRGDLQQRLVSVWFYIAGYGINMFFTDALKHFTSELRPDFFARCQVNLQTVVYGSMNSSYGPWIQEYECTGQSSVVQEGRLAFPSGHSSTSFYTFVFLGLQVYLVVEPFVRQKWQKLEKSWSLIFACLYMAILFAPSAIAVSRVYDYRHFWHDIIAGGIIGIVIAGGIQFLDSEVISHFTVEQTNIKKSLQLYNLPQV